MRLTNGRDFSSINIPPLIPLLITSSEALRSQGLDSGAKYHSCSEGKRLKSPVYDQPLTQEWRMGDRGKFHLEEHLEECSWAFLDTWSFFSNQEKAELGL